MSPHAHLSRIYRPDFGLLTDLYQLTMAAGYYQQRIHERRAVFHLYYRRPPFGGDFALAAGLPLAIDLINNFRFSAEDVQYLGRQQGASGQPLFSEPFLNYLQRMRFTGDLDAIPEGEIVLPNEPLLRIEAPLLQAQLLETALLTVMNFSTLIATKAARIRAAAGTDRVLEFGLRRAQGIDGGLTASRAAWIGGVDATSNVWAGRFYDIPVKGTHAHSWVMVFPDEITAFAAYAEALPDNCVFLVDTYDTEQGIRNAITIGERLRERGHAMLGIRLDSGDLANLSRKARQLLDAAGFPQASVVASDSLDEHAIAALKARGAAIDTWGVGTNLVTARDQPALGGVYKLAALQDAAGEWKDRIKHSESSAKTSFPGRLGVMRYTELTAEGTLLGSQLYNTLDGPPPAAVVTADGTQVPYAAAGGVVGTDLLVPVMRAGATCLAPPDLPRTRDRAQKNWQQWTRVIEAGTAVNGVTPQLQARREAMIAARHG